MTGWRAAAAGAAVAASGAVAVLAYNPFAGHAIGCPFHAMTGWYCPGCGATRATWLLLHGDLIGAVGQNLFFLPAVAVIVLRWVGEVTPTRTAWLPRWVRSPAEIPAVALRLLAVAVVAFGVLRNVPALAFLAPTS